MDKTRTITKNCLLAFVLVSIGFALGKEMTLRRQAAAAGPGPLATSPGGDKVVVYYLHATFRCVTCNEIERLAKTLVETEFAKDLAAGRIEWKEADFQKDEALAKRFGVVASCVVVDRIENGKEAGYQRLDDVWTRYNDPAEFNEYVGSAIRQAMVKGEPR